MAGVTIHLLMTEAPAEQLLPGVGTRLSLWRRPLSRLYTDDRDASYVVVSEIELLIAAVADDVRN